MQNALTKKSNEEFIGFLNVLMKKTEKDINNRWESMKNVLRNVSIRYILPFFWKCIKFNEEEYTDAFNVILYNQFYKQAQRNYNLKLSEVNLKIATTETRAL